MAAAADFRVVRVCAAKRILPPEPPVGIHNTGSSRRVSLIKFTSSLTAIERRDSSLGSVGGAPMTSEGVDRLRAFCHWEGDQSGLAKKT